MSKKMLTILSGSAVFLVAIYLAHYSYEKGELLLVFLKSYFGNWQKCLFLISVFMAPFTYSAITPIYEQTIFLRIKKNFLFVHLVKRSMFSALNIATLLFSVFLTGGAIMALEFVWSIEFVLLFVELLLFVASMQISAVAIYILTKKVLQAILSLLIVNFLIVAIVYNVNFYILGNLMGESLGRTIYLGYLFAVDIFSLTFLYFKSGVIECLLPKE